MNAANITLRVTINYLACDNTPPEAPIIDGPTNGVVDISYNYTFNSIDPDGDQVYYYILWGDGHVETWEGPYPSGVDFEISHTYSKQGTFTIEAKAKDSSGCESGWTTLDVIIPREKTNSHSIRLLYLLLERFQNIIFIIKNIL